MSEGLAGHVDDSSISQLAILSDTGARFNHGMAGEILFSQTSWPRVTHVRQAFHRISIAV